ncbi:saccharopine dehydrogenase family protein [Nafulsella turpanensis]|uniref:saccharopine dehydrogenase family protein n=1 Tax=Nafulsella turpanensis TaxID=1265690 RepID=UPI0004758686|nr:saccharopine dehydrogenase C-terminal domain-containing protein [Nafulsella turpanensis]
MQHILIIGAGRSSTVLINYLKAYASREGVYLTVADTDVNLAQAKAGEGSNKIKAMAIDIFDEAQLTAAVKGADVVISMVPASFHLPVAKACLAHQKHMISASYVSPEVRELNGEAQKKGVLILKECGLDPGLDHMTAMEVINRIRKEGGELLSFKSFTGGLVAPESDNNPWNYKFSWNPRNVVLAGQGTAQYIRHGQYKYIPYHKLFTRTEPIEVDGMGEFEGYANRDSLSYRQVYGIDNIPTLLRGTIRRKGYSRAWNVFVQLGMTDDTYQLEGVSKMTKRDFVNAFLPYNESASVEEKLCTYTGIEREGEEFKKIAWLGMFDEEPLHMQKATPAQVMQKILEEKWQLGPEDKDMIVMQHKFEYQLKGENREIVATLVSKGDDPQQTAMAKTVGLPLGIAAKLLLEGKITRTGVCVPITADIYEPILEELKELGIYMEEKEDTLA